jgi:membrane-associated protease RseP (regulator of RpoE activity)
MGLQPGDQIVEINGEPVTAARIPEMTLKAESGTVALTVERDGEQIRLEPVKPRAKSRDRNLGFTLEGGGDTPVVWRKAIERGELSDRLQRFLSGAGTVAGVRG